MSAGHRLAVFPAQVAYEALRLQDGRILAVEVDQPATVFVVAHRAGNDVEIISRHATEQEAVAACKALAGRVERLAVGHTGGKLH